MRIDENVVGEDWYADINIVNSWEYIEISKTESDRVVDYLIYKNHYVLIKKVNVFLSDHHKIFICRRYLNSYTSEIMLTLHKPKCEDKDITTVRTSLDFHLHWKNYFQKNPLYFGYIQTSKLIMKLIIQV